MFTLFNLLLLPRAYWAIPCIEQIRKLRIREVKQLGEGGTLQAAALEFNFCWSPVDLWASQLVLAVKNMSANAEDIREMSSIPGLGRSPGGGHDNPLQYSCLENPMDRGAWQATVHRFTKSWTQLKGLSTHSRIVDLQYCVSFRL